MKCTFKIQLTEDEIFIGPPDDELNSIEDELSSILDYIKEQI